MVTQSKDRAVENLTWGNHSELISVRMRVRVAQDIVILLQERNLLAEMNGSSNYIKVGEIER